MNVFLHAQDKINEVNKLAHGAKAKIELLDKENDAAKKKKGQGPGTASERTRTTITAGLKKKLKDHMQEFSELRSRIQAEYREVVERRVYTVTGIGRLSGCGGVLLARGMLLLHMVTRNCLECSPHRGIVGMAHRARQWAS